MSGASDNCQQRRLKDDLKKESEEYSKEREKCSRLRKEHAEMFEVVKRYQEKEKKGAL